MFNLRCGRHHDGQPSTWTRLRFDYNKISRVQISGYTSYTHVLSVEMKTHLGALQSDMIQLGHTKRAFPPKYSTGDTTVYLFIYRRTTCQPGYFLHSTE